MRTFNFIQHSFAGGEISPVLAARSDLAKYNVGASLIENMIVYPQGPVSSRPGSFKLCHIAGGSGAHIVPFVFSRFDSLLLCFVNNICIVYDHNGLVKASINTGIPISKVRQIRTAQVGDVVYCVHRDYPPFKIFRDINGWSIENLSFKNGPFTDENATDKKIRIVVRSSELYAEAFGLISDRAYFTPDHVGDILKISYNLPEENEVLTVSKGNSSNFLAHCVRTGWRIETVGKYRATITVLRKFVDDDSFSVYKTYIVDSEKEGLLRANGLADPETPADILFSIDCDPGSPESIKATIYIDSGFLTDYYLVTEYENQARLKVVPLPDSPNESAPMKNIQMTKFWAFGAFSKHNLYPSVVAFHQNRLCFASTRSQPDTVWMSRSNSYEDFGVAAEVLDDDAITFTLSSNDINQITAIVSMSNLLIFTHGAEWRVIGGGEYAPITPTKLLAARQSNYGCADIGPLIIGGRCLFVHSSRQRVLDIGYQLESDSFAGADVAMLAEHLLSGDSKHIVAWAFQQNPCSLVWLVLEDGSFLTLTYRRDQDVIAWSRHSIDRAFVRDIVCLPLGESDVVFFLVELDGAAYLAKFDDINIHSDAGVFADLSDSFSARPFVPKLSTLDLEIPSDAGNTALTSPRFVAEAVLRTYRSAGTSVNIALNDGVPRILSLPAVGIDSVIDGRVTLCAGWSNVVRLNLVGEPGKRLTLLGLVNRVAVGEQMGLFRNSGDSPE